MKLIAHTGKRSGSYMTLLGKPDVKGPRGTSRCRCGYNIKMDLQKMGYGSLE